MGVSKRFWELNVTGMKPRLSLQQKPEDPDLGVTSTKSTQEASDSIGTWHVQYMAALLNFKAAILFDHPEDKLSSEDIDLVLTKFGELPKQAAS